MAERKAAIDRYRLKMTHFNKHRPVGLASVTPKNVARDPRLPKPTGERFDGVAAHEQAVQLYPDVMERLAD